MNDSEKKDILMRRVNELSSELEQKNSLLIKMDNSLSFEHMDSSNMMTASLAAAMGQSYIVSNEKSDQQHSSDLKTTSYHHHLYHNTSVVSPVDDINNIINTTVATAYSSSSSQPLQLQTEKISEMIFEVLHSKDLNQSMRDDQLEELRTDLTSCFISYLCNESVVMKSNSVLIDSADQASELNLITDEYLIGDDISTKQQQQQPMRNDVVLRDQLETLKAELCASQEREEKQKSKLTLLLRKASEMGSSHINSEYQQQIELYKKELVYFEQLAHQNRELGTLGSHDMIERLESEITSKDDEIQRLLFILNERETKLLNGPAYQHEQQLPSDPDSNPKNDDFERTSHNKYETTLKYDQKLNILISGKII